MCNREAVVRGTPNICYHGKEAELEPCLLTFQTKQTYKAKRPHGHHGDCVQEIPSGTHYTKAPSSLLCQSHYFAIVTPPCTHLDPQTQQVMHCAAHAAGGSRVERSVGFLVLAVHLCSAGHQQLHHLQVT